MKIKKSVSMLLLSAAALAMTVLMTACGGKSSESSKETPAQTAGETSKADTPDPGTTDDTPDATKDSASVFPEALEKVDAYPIPDISNTGWELKGGMIKGVEMEESDLQAVLDSCGGKLQFIFLDAEKVQMVNGNDSFDGTYKYLQDNYAINAVFEDYEYYGVLTQMDDITVLILANKTAPETALYMMQIDER